MATLKKLKADYEFWSGAYANVACSADLKGIDRLNDQAEASRSLAVDAFNAYLDELKNQEKVRKTREALSQVMDTIAPTETPFLAKSKPLTSNDQKMTIRKIENKITDEWLLNKHYAKRKCQRMFCFGLFIKNNLEGIVTYGMPPSPQVGRGFLGEENRTKVIELNRLCVNERAPKNSASFLVGRSLRHMKDWAVVSYADGAMGHVGYIYQATNFLYCGATKSHDKEYWIDGKWVHAKVLTNRGITAPSVYAKENNIATKPPQPKHRYIFFGNKKLKKYLKYKTEPYPKGQTHRYNSKDIIIESQLEMEQLL